MGWITAAILGFWWCVTFIAWDRMRRRCQDAERLVCWYWKMRGGTGLSDWQWRDVQSILDRRGVSTELSHMCGKLKK